jgi:hypothetical protein
MLPFRNIGLIVRGLVLALLLPLASAPKQQVEQLIVEKKERYVPAGPGQKPFDVTRHVIRLDEIQAGGPPKNGIPALDHPAFVSASEADQTLKAQDMTLGVVFSGVAKAYPNGQTKIYPYSELKKAAPSLQDEIGGLSFTIRFDTKQDSVAVQASIGKPPPHFVAFLGNARAFFPNAAIYKAR